MTIRTVAPLVLLLAAAEPRSGAAQAAPEPRFRTTLDLGFVNTAGNTRLRTLTVAEQVVFRSAPWRATQTFNIVSGYTNGVETANNIKAGLRGDLELSGRFRAFALLVYERNRFAGIARRFEEGLGLAYGALAGPRHVLDVEAGAGNNQQRGTGGPVLAFWLGRAAARYRLGFGPRSHFEEKLEVLQDLEDSDDTRVNSEAALVAPLSGAVSLRLGYAIRYDNQPEPGFRRTDQILSSGVQMAF